MASKSNREIGPRVVTDWDSFPPIVEARGEIFSTRVLAFRYRKMKEALEAIRDQGMDAKQCRDTASDALVHII